MSGRVQERIGYNQRVQQMEIDEIGGKWFRRVEKERRAEKSIKDKKANS